MSENNGKEIEPAIFNLVKELLDSDIVSVPSQDKVITEVGAVKEKPIRRIVPEIRLSSFDNDDDDQVLLTVTSDRGKEEEYVAGKEMETPNGVESSPGEVNGLTHDDEAPVNGLAHDESPEKKEGREKVSRPPRRVRISESVEVAVEGKPRTPGRRVAILLGFVGKDLQGTSNQSWIRRLPSIARDLEKLLIDSGLVHRFRRLDIAFSARTARDVSAQRYLISALVDAEQDLAGMAELMNGKAPKHIRVFGVRQVTNNFHAKRSCDFLRDPRDLHVYSYYIPSYAFAHPSTEPLRDYRITDERREEVNKFLATFEGDRLFHNFTSVREATYDSYKSSRRFLVSFQVEDVVERDGMELLKISITGQNFMVFQITFMVGLAIAYLRGDASDEIVSRAWKAPLISLPRAPAHGLVLKDVRYAYYNDRLSKIGKNDQDRLVWDEYLSQTDRFLNEEILTSIFETEKTDGTTVKFLESLKEHSYEYQKMTKSLSEEKLTKTRRNRKRSSNSSAS